MKILLTGASGFLGSALARHFLSAGHQVSLLLRPDSQLSRLRDVESSLNISRCLTEDGINAFMSKAEPEVVIHTACAYGRLGETYTQISDANVRFGLLTMQSLRNLNHQVTFINTGTALSPEINAYTLTKHQFAQWGRLVATQSNGQTQFINVLLQHMYGPGDARSKFTTHVLDACKQNVPVLDLTAGEQKRDFIYIDDVVKAFAKLVDRRKELEPLLEIDVGTGYAPTIREFVETVHKLTDSRTELRFGSLPYRTNEAMHCQANLLRMNQLGWSPKYDLRAGLTLTIEQEYQ